MLLNSQAVEKLKSVTEINWYPYYYRTHAQRNEQARMFVEEAGRLLDQQAESTIKHVVELYYKGDIPYERYSELIEQVSKEEEARGAALGAAYARNHVFDFAQRTLDREKEQIEALTLADAKKNHELERQKADQAIKEAVRQGLAEIITAKQQFEEQKNQNTQTLQETVEQRLADLNALMGKQEEYLLRQHKQLVEQTKAQVDQVVSSRLQEEIDKREQAIYERENLRPAREAARAATERVAFQEKQFQTYKLLRKGLIALDALTFLALIIVFLFLSFPHWASAILLIIFASISLTLWIWKSPVSEQALMNKKKEVALFQTNSDDYTLPLGEEERCALLVQRVDLL